MEGSQKPDPTRHGAMGAKGQVFKDMLEVAGKTRHLTVRRWESEEPQCWSLPDEGFRNHVATGAQLGVSGRWRAVVRLDHDEQMGAMHGMYGTLDAELAVQHAIKRTELTAFLSLLRKISVPRWYKLTTKESMVCEEVN